MTAVPPVTDTTPTVPAEQGTGGAVVPGPVEIQPVSQPTDIGQGEPGRPTVADPGAMADPAGDGPQAIVGAVIDQVARAVRPEAAVAIATEFGFPLVLALAVMVYLLIQGQIDRRDPKLRIAPQNITETLIRFKVEEQL